MISDDEPIGSSSDDLLGREDIAQRVAQLILQHPGTAPLVLGIHGPWGSGKSSLIALVLEKLADKAVCVEFEPWLFSDAAQLVRPFFATMYRALSRGNEGGEPLREALWTFAELLANSSHPSREPSVEALMSKTPGELRTALAEISTRIDKRIVIVIDDMDRLPADELGQVLKLVRLCGNLPNFTYVLAYDRTVVTTALKTVYRGDSDFLDKIVQVEVPLPPVPPRLLGNYVSAALSELGDELKLDMRKVMEMFEVRDDQLRQRLASIKPNDSPAQLIRTIRDAKRWMNGLACTLPLVHQEVDLVDFANLELLRLFFPSVYNQVYERRFLFAVYDNDREEAKRTERQAEHQRLAEDLRLVPRGELAVAILTNVFPTFNASLRAQNYYYSQQAIGLREMKASDPGHVEKYFQLRVPLDSVPRRQVRTVIEALNSAVDEAAARETFLQETKRYYSGQQLTPFLDAVHLEVGLISPTRLSSAILAIADVGSLLAEKPMQEREMSTAVIAALRLGSNLPKDQSASLFTTLAASANGAFVVQLLVYAEPNPYQPNGVGVEFVPMHRAGFGHRDHRNRCMTITWFGHGDRSEATLVGPT